MADHTPGPWRVVEYAWDSTSIYGEGRREPVCTLTLPDRAPEEALEAEQRDNARLIASAPELLAALTPLADWDGREAPPLAVLRKWASNALLAVEKARGD
jgi:hypothetical protein